jgi:hypothetical protein
VIASYNDARSPEMEAELADVDGDEIAIVFTGSSCRSCGAQDHLEDFTYEFLDVTGRSLEILGVEVLGQWTVRARFTLADLS